MRPLSLQPDERQLILAGRYGEAILAVQTRTGASFPQARAAVLTWEAERLAALQRQGQRLDPTRRADA